VIFRTAVNVVVTLSRTVSVTGGTEVTVFA
jgi:hypothetical protein